MDWLILYKVFKEVTLKVTHTGGMSHIQFEKNQLKFSFLLYKAM